MFSGIVIANRGESACRIIATARKLGIPTVAVYAPNDIGAKHLRLADIALPVPSYLDGGAIIRCAKGAKLSGLSGQLAVHPGWGFLSENPAFAADCSRAGLVFVGPPPPVMATAADKSRARLLAQKAGVNILPGMPVNAKTSVNVIAAKVGFPLMLKAAAGGGGRGMRIVNNAAAMKQTAQSAKREAENAFGNGALLAERYLPKARHLEVQILADKDGNIVILGERDCSMQRRHQKILEESPAPGLTVRQRQRLHSAAMDIAKVADYENAGTVEFLLDQTDNDGGGEFYFLEINARLQVEHPLTELLYGIDLVEWQLRIAAGECLPVPFPPPVDKARWTMEARICAENPLRNLLPSVGVITQCQLPATPAIRTDSGIDAGDIIGGDYDSMLVKVIATGNNREQCRRRLLSALAKTRIDGIATNTAYLAALVQSGVFAKGATITASAECLHNDALVIVRAMRRRAAFLAAAYIMMTSPCPAFGFRLNDTARHAYIVLCDDEECYRCNVRMIDDEYRIGEDGGGGEVIFRNCRLSCGGIGALITDETNNGKGGEYIRAAIDNIAADSINVFCCGISLNLHIGESPASGDGAAGAANETNGDIVAAPMPGIVRRIMAKSGGKVASGDAIIVMEAMKMDIVITTRRGGIVKMACAVGDIVAAGALLARIDDKGGKGGGAKR